MRRLVAGSALVVAALAWGSSSAAAKGVHVTLGGDARFPARTLVVTGLGAKPLPRAQVHITENGHPVSVDTIESVSEGRRGDLGVVLVIDRSNSMSGAASDDAARAARWLAKERVGQQELGVVTFNGSAAVELPLTTSATAITRALGQLPPLSPGTRILPALSLAIRELGAAKIAAGAVILLSDGADLEPKQTLTPESVAAQAHAAHIQIFTVGLRDQSYTPASMRRLARVGGGEFTQALGGAQLQDIFRRIQGRLASSRVVHYRSLQPLGHRVSVVARIGGTPGRFTLSYDSPPVPRTAAPSPARYPRQSFWDSTLASVLAVAICALLLSLAVWVLLRRRSRPSSASQRVRVFVSGPTDESPPVVSLTDTAARRTRATFSRSSWWPAFAEAADIAMIDQAPEKLVVRTAAGACLVAALFWLLLGSPVVALLPLLAAPFALRAYVQARVRRQRGRFSDLLPSHLEEVTVSIRSGRSLIEALNVVAEAAEEPMHREFDRALRDENLGRPLEDTLRVISARMASESIEQVAIVAAMHRSTGSSVAEALNRVAEGARERADLQREIRTLTAQGRLARWMLTFLPPLILVAMSMISPKYAQPLLHTTGGLMAMGIATVMVIAGSLVMKRIVNIEV